MYCLLILFVCINLQDSLGAKGNNACYSILDYATVGINYRNCWYNPDVGSTTRDIVIRHGYPFESYNVQTEDGYILNLFRIPPANNTNNAQPVFLQHGIATSSIVWVDIGERSLAFQLSNLGYDVWMGNTRGTTYSKGHVSLTVDQKEYWDFSFHEMGIYDIPAEIEFVAKTTRKAGKIIYIGHSMGTSQSYVYATLKEKHAKQNLIGIISMCPIAFMANVQSVLTAFVPYRERIKKILSDIGQYDVNSPETSSTRSCTLFTNIPMCTLLYFMAFGFDYEQFQPQDIPIVFINFQAAASVKSLDHYAQIMASGGRFQLYDYGQKENLHRYNTSTPPVYKVEDITLPVHLLYGKNDYLAGQKDVNLLYDTLRTKKSIAHIAEDDSVVFNHMDFMYAKDLVQLLYRPLLKIMKNNFAV